MAVRRYKVGSGSFARGQCRVRYDAEVIERFRASGEGWQTRMNDVLPEWLNKHPA
jgi:uncharacterized protein (DUF4415 family)